MHQAGARENCPAEEEEEVVVVVVVEFEKEGGEEEEDYSTKCQHEYPSLLQEEDNAPSCSTGAEESLWPGWRRRRRRGGGRSL